VLARRVLAGPGAPPPRRSVGKRVAPCGAQHASDPQGGSGEEWRLNRDDVAKVARVAQLERGKNRAAHRVPDAHDDGRRWIDALGPHDLTKLLRVIPVPRARTVGRWRARGAMAREVERKPVYGRRGALQERSELVQNGRPQFFAEADGVRQDNGRPWRCVALDAAEAPTSIGEPASRTVHSAGWPRHSSAPRSFPASCCSPVTVDRLPQCGCQEISVTVCE